MLLGVLILFKIKEGRYNMFKKNIIVIVICLLFQGVVFANQNIAVPSNVLNVYDAYTHYTRSDRTAINYVEGEDLIHRISRIKHTHEHIYWKLREFYREYSQSFHEISEACARYNQEVGVPFNEDAWMPFYNEVISGDELINKISKCFNESNNFNSILQRLSPDVRDIIKKVNDITKRAIKEHIPSSKYDVLNVFSILESYLKPYDLKGLGLVMESAVRESNQSKLIVKQYEFDMLAASVFDILKELNFITSFEHKFAQFRIRNFMVEESISLNTQDSSFLALHAAARKMTLEIVSDDGESKLVRPDEKLVRVFKQPEIIRENNVKKKVKVSNGRVVTVSKETISMTLEDMKWFKAIEDPYLKDDIKKNQKILFYLGLQILGNKFVRIDSSSITLDEASLADVFTLLKDILTNVYFYPELADSLLSLLENSANIVILPEYIKLMHLFVENNKRAVDLEESLDHYEEPVFKIIRRRQYNDFIGHFSERTNPLIQRKLAEIDDSDVFNQIRSSCFLYNEQLGLSYDENVFASLEYGMISKSGLFRKIKEYFKEYDNLKIFELELDPRTRFMLNQIIQTRNQADPTFNDILLEESKMEIVILSTIGLFLSDDNRWRDLNPYPLITTRLLVSQLLKRLIDLNIITSKEHEFAIASVYNRQLNQGVVYDSSDISNLALYAAARNVRLRVCEYDPVSKKYIEQSIIEPDEFLVEFLGTGNIERKRMTVAEVDGRLTLLKQEEKILPAIEEHIEQLKEHLNSFGIILSDKGEIEIIEDFVLDDIQNISLKKINNVIQLVKYLHYIGFFKIEVVSDIFQELIEILSDDERFSKHVALLSNNGIVAKEENIDDDGDIVTMFSFVYDSSTNSFVPVNDFIPLNYFMQISKINKFLNEMVSTHKVFQERLARKNNFMITVSVVRDEVCSNYFNADSLVSNREWVFVNEHLLDYPELISFDLFQRIFNNILGLNKSLLTPTKIIRMKKILYKTLFNRRKSLLEEVEELSRKSNNVQLDGLNLGQAKQIFQAKGRNFKKAIEAVYTQA